jgi:hypothetical protein
VDHWWKEQRAFVEIGRSDEVLYYFNGFMESTIMLFEDLAKITNSDLAFKTMADAEGCFDAYPSLPLIVIGEDLGELLEYIECDRGQLEALKRKVRVKIEVLRFMIDKLGWVNLTQLFLSIVYSLLVNQEKIDDIKNDANFREATKRGYEEMAALMLDKIGMDSPKKYKPTYPETCRDIRSENQYFMLGRKDLEILLSY